MQRIKELKIYYAEIKDRGCRYVSFTYLKFKDNIIKTNLCLYSYSLNCLVFGVKILIWKLSSYFLKAFWCRYGVIDFTIARAGAHDNDYAHSVNLLDEQASILLIFGNAWSI